MSDQIDDCPNCGMSVNDGAEPTEKDGTTYCCSGCATGGDCTCPGHEHQH